MWILLLDLHLSVPTSKAGSVGGAGKDESGLPSWRWHAMAHQARGIKPVLFSVVHHISQLSKTGGYGKYAEEETVHHRKGIEILRENFKAVNMTGFLAMLTFPSNGQVDLAS